MKRFEITIKIGSLNDCEWSCQVSAYSYEEAYVLALETIREEFDEDARAHIANIIEH